MLAKLNAYARQVSENGMIEVTEGGEGAYWLRLNRGDGTFRTLACVGYKGAPIKWMRDKVDQYFAEK